MIQNHCMSGREADMIESMSRVEWTTGVWVSWKRQLVEDLALTTISLLIHGADRIRNGVPASVTSPSRTPCSCLQVLPPAWPSTANPDTALQSFVQDEMTQLANYSILSPLLSSASSFSFST